MIDCLINCILINGPFQYISLIWGRHHCWQGLGYQFRSMFGAHGLWASGGGGSLLCISAMTQNLGLRDLIQTTSMHNGPLRQARYSGPILTGSSWGFNSPGSSELCWSKVVAVEWSQPFPTGSGRYHLSGAIHGPRYKKRVWYSVYPNLAKSILCDVNSLFKWTARPHRGRW